MAKKLHQYIAMISFVFFIAIILGGCTLPISLPFQSDDSGIAADAAGELVVTSTQSLSQGKKTLSPTASQTITSTLTPSSSPEPSSIPFMDNSYRLNLHYPNSWSLFVAPAGRSTGNGFASKTLQFSKGNIRLLIQYKFKWENTVLGGSMPPGDLKVRGMVNFLDQEIPQHVIVAEGKDKYVFYGGSSEDLDFHIRIESTLINIDSSSIDIPQEVQDETAAVIASIARTGEIFKSPTPTLTPSITPIPSATSRFAASKSGSGAGSEAVEGCNQAKYIDNVIPGERAIIPPGAKFTSTWRIMNVGDCVWTTGYSLVFSSGDFSGDVESVPLPKDVLPGETVNISVDFTAPTTGGHYQSHWVFHDSAGYWFGLGEKGSGFITADIIVAEPEEYYPYDFALDYCDAIWEGHVIEKDENGDEVDTAVEIECPGGGSSSDGSVILMAYPKIELRNENQLTLQVHPYAAKNGWIEGTYPEYEVLAGDHFLTWVGCMQDTPKCSLVFQLNYEDEAGKVHNLGEWFEHFDGKVTVIDYDLSSLVGQKVNFILKTIGNTHNHDAAQGFWFVPRIDR
ncbi:MAG: NBR1-Ig-like domain-containing protein [Chloroflexota bacterium]|nr:NBR1-Ig-like domain-containing protein [Chloroflexota bacterium]